MRHGGTKWRAGVLDGVSGAARDNEMGTQGVFDKRRRQPYD